MTLTSRQLNGCLLVLLLAVAARAYLAPYDVADMMTADATYGIHMLDVPLLEFRPPPPNRLFPDVLLHALVQPFGLDLVGQKIAAGMAVFLLTAWLIGYFHGIGPLLVYLAITTCAGFDFLNTCEHYSLPLTFLLFDLARHRLLRAALLFIAVFSDLLIVLPLIVYFFERADSADRPWMVGVSFAAMVAAVLYAEFAAILIPFAIVLPVAVLVAWWASRRGWLLPLCVLGGAFLILVALAGYHARYSQPILGVLVLVYAPRRMPRLDWRVAVAPMVIVGLFLMTFQRTLNDELESETRCLVRTLADRGIRNVAVEYWTARPLYFEARRVGVPMTLTVTDFNDGDTDPFMAPYDFYGAPTEWGILNHHTCEHIQSHSKHCAQAYVAKVVSQEPVCDNFELLRYATPVPPRFDGQPDGKLPSLRRNFLNYLRETAERLANLGGA